MSETNDPSNYPVETVHTPKRRRLEIQLQSDTPHVQRVYSSGSYIQGDLDEKRLALVHWLPEKVPEIPVNEFIQHVLPQLQFNEDVLAEIYRRLTESDAYDESTRRWKELPDNGTEKGVFSRFCHLQEDIVNCAKGVGSTGQPNVDFRSDGNQIPRQDPDWVGYPFNTRPDGGCYYPKGDSKDPLHWRRLVRADEYKVGTGEEEEFDVSSRVLGGHGCLTEG
jgi:hypothetical protein